MTHAFSRRAAGALALAFAAMFTVGDAAAQLRDFAGTQDPPGMKRFKGSTIHGQRNFNFSEYELVVGVHDWSTQSEARPVRTLEGRHLRTVYIAPKDATPLEVSRNYEEEFTAAGYEIVFRCRNPRGQPGGCGAGLVGRKLLPNQSITKQGDRLEYAGNVADNVHYFVARQSRPEGDFYVALATWEARDGQLNGPFYSRTVALLDTIQTKSMDRQMVFVDARMMQTTIEKDGRISLYGIQFDTDSAVIKPQSGRTLAEIARLMQQNPEWTVRITGHTDNMAPADYNQRLSMQRAQAVVDALQTNYGIAGQRLSADGKGLTQPVASNASEAGRAQNRRVELARN